MADKDTKVHIDVDDWTAQDEADSKFGTRRTMSSVKNTVAANADEKAARKEAARAGRNMKLGMFVLGVRSVAVTHKTKKMEKEAFHRNEEISRLSEEQRRKTGQDHTFGDVFGSAMARIQLEQKQEKLHKLQEKIKKRQDAKRDRGRFVGGVMSAIEQASRTRGVQSSMNRMTASAAGLAYTDVSGVNNGRPDEGMEF